MKQSLTNLPNKYSMQINFGKDGNTKKINISKYRVLLMFTLFYQFTDHVQ